MNTNETFYFIFHDKVQMKMNIITWWTWTRASVRVHGDTETASPGVKDDGEFAF